MAWYKPFMASSQDEDYIIKIPSKKDNPEDSLGPYHYGLLYEIGIYTKGDLEWLKSTPQWKQLKLEKLRKSAEDAQKRYEEAKKDIV